MDLFEQKANEESRRAVPLADRLRPDSFDGFFGQEEIVGKGKFLRAAIEQDRLPSLIFWGPPGTGKTTLAKIIARETKARFCELSAVHSGVKDLREVIKKAEDNRKYYSSRTILFIDEIHRWSKSQQDSLLPYVERGVVTLIGATTENPSFEIISPLLSRARVFVLKSLGRDDLEKIMKRALLDEADGLGKRKIKLEPPAKEFLLDYANGDARKLLNSLESVAAAAPERGGARKISLAIAEEAIQHKSLVYDKGGEEHYNVISAFIKSLRGSDPDAGLYYLARMLEAGEDPLFIARRMVVLASEDIGNADPRALPLAIAAFEAARIIGLPEARINLAQCATYLAVAPKSNASYQGLLQAESDVRETLNLPVPLHLRNAPTKLMKDLGYGKDYKYTHDYPGEKQEFLPEKLRGKKYYSDK